MYSIHHLLTYFSIVLLLPAMLKSQQYQMPLDAPWDISASFGEARNNHYHAGLDFATGGKSLPVKSIADGFVERIKISSGGYGLALYIRHPDQNISVYGHLDHFTGEIAKKVLEIQEHNNFYEFDQYFEKHELPVKKGQIVAYSGNTGSSSGPHLHFEIRGQGFETIHNPLLFDLSIKDQIKPVISAIHIIPFKNFGRVNGKNASIRIPIINGSPDPKIPIPEVDGLIGFAYEGYDGVTRASSRSKVFKTQLFHNEILVFEKTMDSFTFDNTRCVNGFLIYEELIKNKRKVYRCFEPVHHNSTLVKTAIDKGLIHFASKNESTVKLKLSDFSGNQTMVSLKLRSAGANKIQSSVKSKGVIPGVEEVLKFEDGSIFFPSNALFDTTEILAKKNGNIYNIGHHTIPVNESFTLNLKLPAHLAKTDTSKIILKIISGSSSKYLRGEIVDGYFKTKANVFGQFELIVDQDPPLITFSRPKKIPAGTLAFATGRANFAVSDKLSGISHYSASLNGKWILLPYDAKTGKMWVDFPVNLPKGTHELIIKVKDKCANETVLKQNFSK
ncbi:MAG: M23 family metallopeptidase [Flavobacteriales bacterium]